MVLFYSKTKRVEAQMKNEAEHIVQAKIRIAASPHAALFRTNAGEFWQGHRVWSNEYGQMVLINLKKVEGLPKGYSDLSGVRKRDGRAVFIECKTICGKVREEQQHFIDTMKSYGAIAGVARSENDALKLLEVM
jgi:hypothetical protein